MILRVENLRVQKLEERPGVNRPYAIDAVSFVVQTGELVLTVGGPGAGKTALKSALLSNDRILAGRVEYAPGVCPRDTEDSSKLPVDVSDRHLIIKDGFQTRVGHRSDDHADDHWKLFDRVRASGASLMAFAEIERLTGWREGAFTRVIVLRDGSVFLDGTVNEVRTRLSERLESEGHLFRPEDRSVLARWTTATTREDARNTFPAE